MRETESEGMWNAEPVLFTELLKFVGKVVVYTPVVCFKWQGTLLERASWANMVLGVILLVAAGGWGFTFYSLSQLEFVAMAICFTVSCGASAVAHGLMVVGIGEDVGYFRDL